MISLVLLMALPAAGTAAEQLVNPATLVNEHLAHGDALRVEIKDGLPADAQVRLTLAREGAVIQLPDAKYAAGAITATIGDDVPYGSYVVSPVANGRLYRLSRKLVVEPVGGGAVTLAQFDPSETYDTEPFWIPAQKPGGRPAELRTVRLTLHGKGFLPSSPADNQIWINGFRRNDILWDQACSDPNAAGTENSPKPHKIHAEARSAEEILLCFVPVPADGQLRLAAGFGDTPSNEVSFGVFRMGKARVAT